LDRKQEERVVIAAAHQTMLAPPALPYDAEVEYLESTGTQYVDTGVLLARSGAVVDYRVRFSYTSLSTATNRYSVCGAYEKTGAGRRNGYTTTRSATSAFMAIAIGASAPNTSVSASVGTVYDFSVRIDDPSKRVTVVSGGATVLSQTISGDYPSITNYLFARNGSTPEEFSSARLYSFSQSVDGVLVRDFIPVRVGSGAGAVGYLFDRVSGTLFGNAGTGAFGIGPDK
jgi:hypothetical protein